MPTPSRRSVLYLDVSAYHRILELAGETLVLSQGASPRVVLFDEVALLELANTFRFGGQAEGRRLFELIQKLPSPSLLKPFGQLLRDEVKAVLEERPRPRWEMGEEEREKVLGHIGAFARGEFGPAAESHLKERRSRLEAFGRAVDLLFKEASPGRDDTEDFQELVARWGGEGRREELRKFLAEVMRTERPSALARKVEGKLSRCPCLSAFLKIPVLKHFLYRVRYEDRKRSDAEEFIHLAALAYADVLLSERGAFRERFRLLHPQKEAYALEEFLSLPRPSLEAAPETS